MEFLPGFNRSSKRVERHSRKRKKREKLTWSPAADGSHVTAAARPCLGGGQCSIIGLGRKGDGQFSDTGELSHHTAVGIHLTGLVLLRANSSGVVAILARAWIIEMSVLPILAFSLALILGNSLKLCGPLNSHL